jgi:large subunit ribosomal protein L22
MTDRRVYKSEYKNARQTALKVRNTAKLVRGKNAQWALDQLSLLNKKGAKLIRKTLASAVANARDLDGVPASDLVITKLLVNEARTEKRGRFASRGRFAPILKRRSHILIELSRK